MKAKVETDQHQLTVREIERLTGQYNSRRHAVTEQLALIYGAREVGTPAPEPLTERAVAARELALSWLNGHAPPSMKATLPFPQEEQLNVELAAIDLVLATLSQRENIVRAAEAEQYAHQHRAEWTAIVRDALLGASMMRAAEARAVKFRQKLGGIVPNSLQLAAFIGI